MKLVHRLWFSPQFGMIVALGCLSIQARGVDFLSSGNFGVSLLNPATQTSVIGNPDFFGEFQAEIKSHALFRPEFRTRIEGGSGSSVLLMGQASAGIKMVAAEAHTIRPFVTLDAAGAWASLSNSSSQYVGALFGAVFTAGTEISLTKDDEKGLVLATGYRYLSGVVSPQFGGASLTCFQFTVGYQF